MKRKFPHCDVWDYWAGDGPDGRNPRMDSRSPGRPSEYDAGFSASFERPTGLSRDTSQRVGDYPGSCQPWVSAPRRVGLPPTLPYRWRPTDRQREAWVASMVGLARRRARDRIAGEIESGRWWVPGGFTVADLDAMIAEVY